MKIFYLLYFVLFLIITNSIAAIIQPLIPPAQAQFSPQQACLLPLEQMRREHGDLLKQAHHAAAEQHIVPAYQLGFCLDCHVTRNSQGKFPTADSNAHFCQSCHIFVGTKTTCFSCHPAQ
ncbi:MAG: hypothetical protein RL368_2381 [Pseudomonadota bacterium]